MDFPLLDCHIAVNLSIFSHLYNQGIHQEVLNTQSLWKLNLCFERYNHIDFFEALKESQIHVGNYSADPFFLYCYTCAFSTHSKVNLE